VSLYIVIHGLNGPFHVVRTTDLVILATCSDSVVADQIAALFNQYVT
jgi:hypothetical protein